MKNVNVFAIATVAALSVAGVANATAYTDGGQVYTGLNNAYTTLGGTGLPSDVTSQLNHFLDAASDQISHTAGTTTTTTVGGVTFSYTTAGSLSGTYSVGDAVIAANNLVDGVLDDFVGEDTNGVRTELSSTSLIGTRVTAITDAASTFSTALTSTTHTGDQVRTAHATFVNAVSVNQAAINTGAAAAGALEGITITNRADALRYDTALVHNNVPFANRVGQLSRNFNSVDWNREYNVPGETADLRLPTGWIIGSVSGVPTLQTAGDGSGVNMGAITGIAGDGGLSAGATIQSVQQQIDAAVRTAISGS